MMKQQGVLKYLSNMNFKIKPFLFVGEETLMPSRAYDIIFFLNSTVHSLLRALF